MNVTAPETTIQWKSTVRLVPTRFPSTGILDRIAEPDDLEAIIELESWTNDRIATELGTLHRLPREEWVVGKTMASVIMAAYCHPRITGARFTGPDRGGWYAGRTIQTSHSEVIFHRTKELDEIGVFETFVQARAYLADFSGPYHDIREGRPDYGPLYSPNSYSVSQRFGHELFKEGSNGIVYRSVRHTGGECLACFRPKKVLNVRVGKHYEYRWHGTRTPEIRELKRVLS
jgi:RES domain